MQIGLAVIAIFSLAFLSASGGLAPDRVSVTDSEAAGSVRGVTQVTGVEATSQSLTSYSSSARQTERTVESITEDFRTPLVDTESVRNIEDDSALIRASVDMRSYKGGTVFVVYGYSQNQVNLLSRSNQIPDRSFSSDDDRARVTYLDLNPRGQEAYERRISRLVSGVDYYYQVCLEYTTLSDVTDRVCSNLQSFATSPVTSLNNRFQEPRISARRALNVTADEASVSVSLRMNDGEDGMPFIVYGLFKEFVDEIDDRYSSYSSIKQYDEDLQKRRLGVGRLGQSQYEVLLDDLRGGSQYYYRSCVQYDGRREGLVCDSTRSFETNDRSMNNKPFVATNRAVIAGTEMRLSGRVQMADFIDGYAFFVYGTDLERVKSVDGKNSFNRISQSVDRLQKLAVDDDVDGNDSFSIRISDLKVGELYHYRLCVQYVDENKYGREEFFINCGEVRSFVGLD